MVFVERGSLDGGERLPALREFSSDIRAIVNVRKVHAANCPVNFLDPKILESVELMGPTA